MRQRTTRRRRTAPTISDVARHAGVSPMTVSRVINGEANVRPATRDSVQTAIEALRYAPNPAARSLAGAGQARVALLFNNPSAGFLSELMVGSLDQASRSDVQLILEQCEEGEHEVEVARHLIDSGIDGVILPAPLCDSAPLLDVLAEAGVPSVAVGSGAPRPGRSAVVIDNERAAAEMTRHLLALGHRRIGFIKGNPKQGEADQRLAGHRAALAEAGVTEDGALIVDALFTYRSGMEATERLLDLAERPTAIFASNDDMAAAAVAVAHRRGLGVPGELSVVGFDDTLLATTIWPELTTIRQPIAEMARAALTMLVGAIRQPPEPDAVTEHRCEFTLVRRQSDARPR